MAEDYYKNLGVSKTATDDEIHKAYLGLARKYHPDMNLDDPEGAKKKFQEIQRAYDVLKDRDKRKKYDQFGDQFEQFGGGGGAGGFPPGGFGNAGGYQWQGGGPGGGFGGGGGGINLDEILGMFNQGGQAAGTKRRRKSGPVQGENLDFQIEVPLPVAVRGGKIPLNFDNGSGKISSVDVNIPTGLEEGQKIRLRGLGRPGMGGGPAGDLVLEVGIKEHPHFIRKGYDLLLRVPITLKEAALGSKIDVPTPGGTVTVTIPAGSTTGTKLRVKGHGIPAKEKEGKTEHPAGNLIIEFDVQLPKSWSKQDQDLLEKIDSTISPPIRRSLHF